MLDTSVDLALLVTGLIFLIIGVVVGTSGCETTLVPPFPEGSCLVSFANQVVTVHELGLFLVAIGSALLLLGALMLRRSVASREGLSHKSGRTRWS